MGVRGKRTSEAYQAFSRWRVIALAGDRGAVTSIAARGIGFSPIRVIVILYALRVINKSDFTIAMYAHVHNDDPALTAAYPAPVCAYGSGDSGPKAIPILDTDRTYQMLSGAIVARLPVAVLFEKGVLDTVTEDDQFCLKRSGEDVVFG